MAGTRTLDCRPNEKQKLFFEATAPHIAYGGARGGGKSWAMRRKFELLALRYPKLRILLLRRTLPELEGNHIIPMREELQGIANYNAEKKVFTFSNGSFIKLGYCAAEADALQYQGQEYEVIGFEEATQFTEYQMQYIGTCNRTTRTDFSPRCYYTCNPGGIGHNYIKRLFIDRNFTENENPEDYVFIQARVTDNKVLMQSDPQYIKQLERLPETLRRAHLDGDWDVIEGQYFSEFRRDIHVVEPFEIPKDWKKFRSMDWGYNDPCCVLWNAVDPEGRVYIYREIYQNQTLATELSRLVCKKTGDEKIAYTVASPDMWQKRGIKDVYGGETIAETFIRNGVPLQKADNNRLAGWLRVRENLALREDGKPNVCIFNTCTNLIRTLPLLSFDPNDREDVSDRCEDHAPEAMRYGLMSRPSPARRQLERRGNVIKFDPFYVPKKQASGYFNL